MSIFPASGPAGGRRGAEHGTRLETSGMLVRPISGQIYLIEEDDLEMLMGQARSPLSGLVSRH